MKKLFGLFIAILVAFATMTFLLFSTEEIDEFDPDTDTRS
jgi:hypothetical protein